MNDYETYKLYLSRDVAGCVRLWNGQCTGKDNKLLGNCIDLDCELKQLKRLEQENAELKIYIESNKQQVDEVETLVMDNDRLQNELIESKGTCLGIELKYRTVLENIKSISEHCMKQDMCTLCEYNTDCSLPDNYEVIFDNNRLIIKLIDEVLNETAK